GLGFDLGLRGLGSTHRALLALRLPGAAGGAGSAEETACESRGKRSMAHGPPSCSFSRAAPKSTWISRSLACRAAVSRWRVRSRRQAAEQAVWRPVRSTFWQTGHRRRDPTIGVRTGSAGTLAQAELRTWLRPRGGPGTW